MTITKKTKVTTAVSAAVQSFADEIMLRVNKVEADQNEVDMGRKGIMATLVATYGVQAVRPAKQGGISGNAMRTEESIKAEASRLGITPGAARELYFDIIKAINALRLNVWEDYQTAYFGEPEKKAAAPKDEPQSIKELKAKKAEHEESAAANKIAAKEIELEIMKVKDEGEKAQLQKKLKTYRTDAKYFTEQAKECATRIKEEAENNAGADAYGTLCEALKKLGEKYKAHKDDEVAELAQQVLALL